MPVKIRPYKSAKGPPWEVDITLEWANGEKARKRVKSPVPAKSGSRRWGEARERALLEAGPPSQRREPQEVPTLEAFYPRFFEGYVLANRRKPSYAESVRSTFRSHLFPALGHKKLDAITDEDIQRLKGRLRDRSPKTVNNVISKLNVALKAAVEWGVIERMPCTIRLLKVMKTDAEFFDFAEYERLLEGAGAYDDCVYVLVLLGGDAGLRRGEIVALEWSDIDFQRGFLTVSKSEWRGHVTSPKGGKIRRVPMTSRLAAALKAYRHLRGDRVLYRHRGGPLTNRVIRNWMKSAERRAGLKVRGGVHKLRHTFCSHLAMKGAPARAIQELAGHANISTTQRYMHLSPAALDRAIRLLEQPVPKDTGFGDILETEAQKGPFGVVS